jgi:azurin
MAHSSPSSTASGGSVWSILNVLLACGFAAVTLFLGGSFVLSGFAARAAKNAPKAPAAEAAPAAAAPAAAAGPSQELALTPDTVNPMAYAIKLFNVKAGQPVKLTFTNKAPLPLPHNVVVGKAGSKDALMAIAMKLMTDPAGLTKGYVPDETPDVIAHTKLVQPGQSETISFTCPTPGEYPYMCMFPGHSIMMNGIIKAE